MADLKALVRLDQQISMPALLTPVSKMDPIKPMISDDARGKQRRQNPQGVLIVTSVT